MEFLNIFVKPESKLNIDDATVYK